jgi:hypothetical protein
MALIRYQNAGGLGLNLDADSNDLASSPAFEWSGGENVRFYDGYAEKFTGHAKHHGDVSVVPYGVFFSNASSRYEVYTGLERIYAVTGTTHTDITRSLGVYTGGENNKWTGGTLAGTLILNNGADDPQFWAGDVGTPCAKLTNWPASTKCKIIRVFDNFIIALNITEGASNYHSMVRWSTPADPGTLPASWDYTLATNEAGRIEGVLSSTPDKIVDGLPQQNIFFIYKEKSIYAMQYTGGRDIFSFTSVNKTQGALATGCVADTPIGHVVLTDGDVIVNQAGNIRSIIDGRMRKWLFETMDSDNRERSFVAANPYKNEAWICFPTSGQSWPDKALVWNYRSNTFAIREIPNLTAAASGIITAIDLTTWDSRTDIWNDADDEWASNQYSQASQRLVLASSDNYLFLADNTRAFNGSQMTAYIERTGLDFGEPEYRKLCKQVRPRFDAATGTTIKIYVGSQTDLDGAITWSEPVDFVVGTHVKADFMVSGRYLAVKFESYAQGAWRLRTFDMDIARLGMY